MFSKWQSMINGNECVVLLQFPVPTSGNGTEQRALKRSPLLHIIAKLKINK